MASFDRWQNPKKHQRNPSKPITDPIYEASNNQNRYKLVAPKTVFFQLGKVEDAMLEGELLRRKAIEALLVGFWAKGKSLRKEGNGK